MGFRTPGISACPKVNMQLLALAVLDSVGDEGDFAALASVESLASPL